MRSIINWINAHQNSLSFMVVCTIVVIMCFLEKQRRKIARVGMGLYAFFVLYKTVLSRKSGTTIIKMDLGWSYKALICGEAGMFSQIYLNIMLFIPIGLFCGILFLNTKKRSRLLAVRLGVIFTTIIECLQLILRCGTFELDDILNNTIGTIIGVIIADKINKKNGKKMKEIRND